MVAVTQRQATNWLIDALPRVDQDRLLTRVNPVELALGTVLCEEDEPLREVYFPLTGFISFVGAVDGHPPLEIALVGNEGMLGATLVLGVTQVPMRAVVQGGGTALRMSAHQMRRELCASSALTRTLNRYLFVLMAQLSQNALCTQFHEIQSRLARWLLLSHDRAHRSEFRMTHEALAEMLGVRRSSVTVAAGALQQRNLIRYVRGRITVLSRKGLEGASCQCYRAAVNRYTVQFPHFDGSD